MLEYFVYNYGNELIGLLMAAILGCLGNALRLIYRKYVDDWFFFRDMSRKIAFGGPR